MRLRFVLAILAALALSPSSALAQDEAAAAWVRGDMATAERLYGARLAADSADQVALHRMGLIRAWAERYDEAVHLLDRLLAFAPDNREAAIDRARVLAWKGDTREAVASLDRLLARDPAYLPALQARAQFASWGGRYDAALADYNRILQISPGEPSVAYEQARVLSWASRFNQAAAVYDSLLVRNPNDRDALLGLGQVLSWAGRLDSAAVVYRRVLAADPANLDARRGLARTAAWSGRLAQAEEEWRNVLAVRPNDAAALVGLSQTLRWQGRDATALEAARRAVAAAPTDRDARTELEWALLPMRPRTAPSFVYESDSDGNRIATTAVSAGWRPAPRLEVRGEGYFRQARQEDLVDEEGAPLEFESRAQGAVVTARAELEPGWSLSAGAGVSTSDVDDADPTALVRVTVTPPILAGRTLTLAYTRQAVDGTALLVRRQVVGDELGFSGSMSPAQGWTLSAGAGGARFRGRVSGESNRRWNGNAALARRLSRLFTVGMAARAFGWRKDLNDGYFDPEFYGLGELTGRLLHDTGRWVLNAEVAPGLQQIRWDGDPSGALRATGGLAYVFGPGRQLGLSAAYADAGLQSLSPGEGSDYTYRAFSVTGSWAF